MSAKTPPVGIDHPTVVPANAGVKDDNAETDEADESAETVDAGTVDVETLDA
jgi:hypothetical protein